MPTVEKALTIQDEIATVCDELIRRIQNTNLDAVTARSLIDCFLDARSIATEHAGSVF